MSDRLGDLLVATAQEEMDGVQLAAPSDDVMAVTPIAGRRRRWPMVAAVAAALVVLTAGVGALVADRNDEVRTVDPVDGAPVVTDPVDRLPGTTADAERIVADAAAATMAEPWTATLQVGAEPLDKVRYQPLDKFRLDMSDGASTIWAGGRTWTSPSAGAAGEAADPAWTESSPEDSPNPFGPLNAAIGSADRATAVAGEPGTFVVDASAEVCLGADAAPERDVASVACRVRVAVVGDRIDRITVLANSALGTEQVVLDLGPADPTIRVEVP